MKAKCRWKEEKIAKEEVKKADERRREIEKLWLRSADEAAESVGEFFEAMLEMQI